MSLIARLVLFSCSSAFAAGCESEQPIVLPSCPNESTATPDVAGTYRYWSDLFHLQGTITFERSGDDRLLVTDTTYDSGHDRALQGEGPLEGNRATVVLSPKNGDTDYSATVTFAFSADGEEFCLMEFSDTNGDRGGEGTYMGVKR